MQKRNASLLKFQERLIKAAMQSPQREAMNLMGIIYSNLREFVEVRMPMDDDFEGSLDAFIDTLDLFDYALRMKFSNLYMNQFQNSMSKINTFTELCYAYKQSSNGDGIFHDGLYIHPWRLIQDFAFNLDLETLQVTDTDLTADNAALELLVQYQENAQVLAKHIPLTLKGSRQKISVPPYLVRSEDLAVEVVSDWINNQSTTFDNVIRFQPRFYTDTDDTFENFKVESVMDRSATISFVNPLFIHFDRVASFILSHSEDDMRLHYSTIPNFYGLRMGAYIQGNTNSLLLRTPYISDNDNVSMVIEHIMDALNINLAQLDVVDKWLNAPTLDQSDKILEEFRERISEPQYIKPVRYAFMSIYRTDHDMYHGSNYRFILLMAMMLGNRCHVFIEARAREDEKNNLKLAEVLRKLGATIHVQSYGFNMKVHAKVWHFYVRDRNMDTKLVTVFSTGNFVESAQKGFADTIVIRTDKINESSSTYRTSPLNKELGKYLDYVYFPNRFDPEYHNESNDFIWYPGDVSKRLEELIRYSHKGNFIWIKCNHITDPKIIKLLRDAVKRGVMVRILVRTTCTIPHSLLRGNFNENIAARSIVGRYLEHDRYYIFGEINPDRYYPTEELDAYVTTNAYISSADLMPRNLHNRVEFMYQDAFTKMELPKIFFEMYNKETNAEEGYFNISL